MDTICYLLILCSSKVEQIYTKAKTVRGEKYIMENRLKLQQLLKFDQPNIALALKAATVVITTMAFFFRDLTMIFSDALRNETTSYVLIIPLIFAYLVYRKRNMIRATVPQESPKLFKKIHLNEALGGLLLLISMGLYWHGSYTFMPLEYHMLALPLFIAACTLILFNTETLRQLTFPLLFLFLLVPLPEEIVFYIGSALSTASTQIVCGFLKTLGYPVSISTQYENPTLVINQQNGAPLNFTVDIACSGIHSFIGFFIFAIFFAYLVMDKTWKKVAAFFFGFPLIYFLNTLRISVTLLIGYYYGMALAVNIFHLIGGWSLIFIGTLLMLLILKKLFKIQFLSKTAKKCDECNPVPRLNQSFCFSCGRILRYLPVKLRKSDIAKMVIIAAIVVLTLTAQTSTFALTEGPAELVVNTSSGQKFSTEIFPRIRNYTLSYVYRDRDFEQLSKQDMSLVYAYTSNDNSTPTVWVSLEIAETLSSLHRWETCLMKWPLSHNNPALVYQIDLRDIEIVKNPPIIGRFFAFQYVKSNTIQTVLYWYETTAFLINSTSQQKNVKISLSMYPENQEQIPEFENQLLTFGIAIAGYWQPIKTWSQMALLTSQNGYKLVIVSSGMLTLVIVFYMFERRRDRRINGSVYQKLSESDKQIVLAVHQTQKVTTPTLNNIVSAYQKLTKTTVDKEKFSEKLFEVENTDVIRSALIKQDDVPIKVWKIHMDFQTKS
jgi:exosortase